MGVVLFFVIVAVILIVQYNHAKPQRDREKELIQTDIILVNEQIKAERAKQTARAAGDLARSNIDRIASQG